MPSVFSKHLWVCTQEKPEGLPSCSAIGGKALANALRAEIARAGLAGEVFVTECGCLELCLRGPNVVVYPEGHWYTQVKPEDVQRIVHEHLIGGTPVAERGDPDPATIRAEIADHTEKVRAQRATNARAGVIPDPLSTMLRGFQSSRVLLTAVELDVFSAVGTGATAGDVADRIGTDGRATEALLNALVGLGLLSTSDSQYTNGEWAATFLCEGAPHDSRAALMHTAHLWTSWSRLTDCVKAGTAVNYDEMVDRGDDWTEAFIAAMHKNASVRAPLVVRTLNLDGVHRILDLGGGSGAYAIAFARTRPDIVATVFDLPTVLPITKRYADASGVGAQIQFVTGDLRRDPYGHAYDMAFISAICHMNGPEENVAMLSKTHQALRPGGRVVIQDFILHDDKSGPLSGTLFALNMLVNTKHGSAYSGAEYTAWLTEAGFAQIERIKLPGPTDLIVGSRP